MIYHIIRGHVLHTSPSIVRTTLSRASCVSPQTAGQHFFCIIMFDKKMLYSNVDENPYEQIFNDYGVKTYKLFYNKKEYIRYLLNISTKDKIILHGNMDIKFQFLSYSLLFTLRYSLLRRITLVCWGNNDFVRGKKIRTKMSLGLLRGLIYPRLHAILTLSEEDRKSVKELYPNANVLYLPYMTSKARQLNYQNKKDEKLMVMVSHSGWKENNHIKSFNILEKFKGKIKVVCPLCYGDPMYINDIIQHGTSLFGKDFEYFQDLKPINEYKTFVQRIDVYVTAAERQTGLGAIYTSMTGGAKIYLTGNLLQSLLGEGYMVFDFNAIRDESFENFSAPLTYETALKNVERYNYMHFDGESILNCWRSIYEY